MTFRPLHTSSPSHFSTSAGFSRSPFLSASSLSQLSHPRAISSPFAPLCPHYTAFFPRGPSLHFHLCAALAGFPMLSLLELPCHSRTILLYLHCLTFLLPPHSCAALAPPCFAVVTPALCALPSLRLFGRFRLNLCCGTRCFSVPSLFNSLHRYVFLLAVCYPTA
jgi:hypothetical protein